MTQWPHVRLLGWALSFALCAIACSAASAAAPATREIFDDRRSAQQALDDLDAAGATGNYADLESRTRGYLHRRLAASPTPNLDQLNDLLFVLRSCRYLAMVEKLEGGRKLATWIIAHRPTARLLYRAMEDVSSPEDSLKISHVLWKADEKRVAAYDDLAVAFATSQPLKHYIRQPNPASRLESFQYYTDPKNSFRYDLKAMPFEYSRFLADTQLSLAERQWVRQRHGGTTNLPGVYFSVPYDMNYFFKGQPKKISRADYTLGNLERLGGVCVDQAYFAAEVCKAMGVPATIVFGHAADGGNHAWLACLKIKRVAGAIQVEWDTQTARYAEHRYYTGTLTDPGTGQRIHDCDLVLLGAAALLPRDRREAADTATTVAIIANQANRNRPAEPPVASGVELPEGMKIDPAIVEKLLIAAAEKNLAHRKTWELVADLGKAGDLSTDCIDRLFEFVVNRTAKDFPDYACNLILRLAPCYEPVRRDKTYLRAIELYRRRPDLQGKLMVARGDDLAQQGKKDQAMKVYKDVMNSRGDLTETLLLAAQHAGDLMVAQNQRTDAIALYQKLWSESDRPRMRNGAYSQTSYYQLGRRLADLLREDGQAEAAQKVMSSVGDVPDLPEKA